MATIKHETFGELTCNYGWKRDINIPLFGHEKNVTLNIDADDDGSLIANRLRFARMQIALAVSRPRLFFGWVAPKL